MKTKILMLVSLLLMIAGIVVSSLLFIRLQERNVELKRVSDQRDSINKNLELARDELEIRMVGNDTAVGNKKIETLKDSLEMVSKPPTTIVNRALTQKEKSLRAKLKNASYFVGVFSLNTASGNLNKTVNFLNASGYSVVAQVELNDKPSWLANAPTVFYYDPATRTLAQNLAHEIGTITNTKLRVEQGAGLGVPEGMRGQYLYVHLVGEGERTKE